VADDHHRTIIQACYATDDRRVVSKVTITVQFVELTEQLFDVVQGIGAARVAGQLGNLPAAQVAEDTGRQAATLVLQAGNLVADVQRIVATHQAQLFDLGLQVGDRLFEIEKIRVHRLSVVLMGPVAGSCQRSTLRDRPRVVDTAGWACQR